MATLDQPIQLPPGLQHENAPSVAALIGQIDRWVIYHLKKTILSDIHYENQLYGVINAFHTSIFPLHRRFMVIPQGLVRRAMYAEEIEEDLSNVSFGSTGAFHESRDIAGHETEKTVPDFVTVKVTPQPGRIRDHRIVCIVEIKRDNVTEATAMNKMFDYMNQAAQHGSRERNLRGFLVMANEVVPFRLNDYGDVTYSDSFDMFAPGDQFTRMLGSIAIRNWN